MSSMSTWANKNIVTLWRKGSRDRLGEFSYGNPEYILCGYRQGGSEEYLDSTGTKFRPDAIYYTEMKTESGDYLSSPTYGDKLMLGSFIGHPPASAADIRMITIDDAQMFGPTEQPDYKLGV